MNILMQKRFKSISDFKWDGVPAFSVITGINGSGKTHLLELLHISLGAENPQHLPKAEITYGPTNSAEVVYIPDTWKPLTEPGNVSLSTLQELNDRLWSDVQAMQKRRQAASVYQKNTIKELERILKKKLVEITQEDIVERVGVRNFLSGRDLFNSRLSEIFHDYFIRHVEVVERQQMSEKLFREEFGPPPWTLLKEILDSSHLPFSFAQPTEQKLWQGYQFRIVHTLNGAPIKFADLSSGEKVLFSLVLWLFTSQNGGRFPSLLLLDEPDAHLHPSMTKRFLDAIFEVLVKKHEVRVIMTTHSPSTAALTPDGSLFELIPPGPKIAPAVHAQAIARLTSGFITVMKTTRHVLVEDEADRNFYETVFQICVEDKYLDPTIGLVFIPSSSPGRRERPGDSGGRNEVRKIIERLSDTALSEVICGLVDGDAKDPERHGRIFTLSRYCIENYLIDPILIFGSLLEMKYEDIPECIRINYGQEPSLAAGKVPLQPIVDWVVSEMGLDASNTVETKYSPRGSVNLPRAIYSVSGKELLSKAYDKFGGAHVNRSSLQRSLSRVRLIPSDLIAQLKNIQEASRPTT